MPRRIDDHHWAIGRYLIELFMRRSAAFPQRSCLIPKSDDPCTLGCTFCLFLHPRNKFRDVGTVEQIRIDQVLSEIDKVPVRIDEPWQKRLAFQVDAFAVGTSESCRLGKRSSVQNLPILHHQTLNILRRRPSHGEDIPSQKNACFQLRIGQLLSQTSCPRKSP